MGLQFRLEDANALAHLTARQRVERIDNVSVIRLAHWLHSLVPDSVERVLISSTPDWRNDVLDLASRIIDDYRTDRFLRQSGPIDSVLGLVELLRFPLYGLFISEHP